MPKDNKQKGPVRRLADLLLEQSPSHHGRYADYYAFLDSSDRPKLEIEIDPEYLTEAKRITIGRFTARRDPPHFAGDNYHGHCDVGGGHELSWEITGKRRHSTKFPAVIPNDAKAAVAKVLGVSSELLESYWISVAGARGLLIEVDDAA